MVRRSFIRSLRDGVFFASAFAMVLYMTLATHHRAGPEDRLAAMEPATVADGEFAFVGEDRMASAVSTNSLP